MEDVVEYGLLKDEYAALETKYNELVEKQTQLEQELASLTQFKTDAEREKKQEMINSFYMLSDDDKKDVVANIDTYSLDDIEAKLSVICVRIKVSFDLDENKETKPTTYNLNNGEDDDESIPAWVKAALKYENAR